MKTRFWVLVVLVGLIISPARAGTEVGNGGDVLVKVGESSPGPAILFDFFEGQSRYGLKMDVFDESSSPDEIVRSVLLRFKDLSNFRYKRWSRWLDSFWSESEFINEDLTLVDVPDTADAFIPVDMEIKQAAVQREPMFGEKRYVISKKYWNAMSPLHKAGLILHEIILREAITPQNAHVNSRAARYLNAYLFSTAMQKITFKDFNNVVLGLKFKHIDAHGFEVAFPELKQKLVEYHASNQSVSKIRNGIWVAGEIQFNDLLGNNFLISDPNWFDFYQDGTPRNTVHLKNKTQVKTKNSIILLCERAQFDSDRNIKLCDLSHQDHRWTGPGYTLELAQADFEELSALYRDNFLEGHSHALDSVRIFKGWVDCLPVTKGRVEIDSQHIEFSGGLCWDASGQIRKLGRLSKDYKLKGDEKVMHFSKGAVIAFDRDGTPSQLTQAPPQKATATLAVEAHIDGQSELCFSENNFYWRNLYAAAPGRHLTRNLSTRINGADYWPVWPLAGENYATGEAILSSKVKLPFNIDAKQLWKLALNNSRANVSLRPKAGDLELCVFYDDARSLESVDVLIELSAEPRD